MRECGYTPIIQSFRQIADQLYAQANVIIFLWTVFGFLVGIGPSYVLGKSFGDSVNLPMFIFLGSGVFAVLGFLVGTSRALHLKFKAQLALCLRKIEENTRK